MIMLIRARYSIHHESVQFSSFSYVSVAASIKYQVVCISVLIFFILVDSLEYIFFVVSSIERIGSKNMSLCSVIFFA